MDAPNAHDAPATGTQAATEQPSRALWFILGSIAGVFLAVCIAAVVGVLILYGGRELKRDSSDFDHVARLARIVAAPLTPPDPPESPTSQAQLYVAIGDRIDQATSIAKQDSELAPIALEYADCMRNLQNLLSSPPSLGPLMEKGVDTWRSSANDDDKAAFFSGLGFLIELGKLTEATGAVRTIHARILACRLRLAEVCVKRARPEVDGNTINWRFEESGVDAGVKQDRFLLSNVSGENLTHALLVTEVAGADGDIVSNVYFADRWDAGQSMQALCASESLWRETVHHAKRMRCRLFSDERTSRLGEATR